MQIPVSDKTGFRTVSASMLATYGYGSYGGLDDLAEPRGCPRQYQAKYDGPVRLDLTSEPQLNGKVKHAAIAAMEEQGIGPEEALAQVWDPALSAERYEEALADLRGYLDRESTPLDRYGVLANEKWLAALLYVDEDFGPIYLQGYVDRISVDFDTPNVIHIGDWKFVNNPPSVDDVMKSDQLKGYHWLVGECYQELGLFRKPNVVVHLDAVKWFELPPVHFTDATIEAWHARTVSIVKQILRDTEAKPKLNWGCSWCPVKDTCPEYQRTPDLALELLQILPFGDQLKDPKLDEEEKRKIVRDHANDVASWMERANNLRLLLEKQHDELNDRFKLDAIKMGQVETNTFVWSTEPGSRPVTDLRALHNLIDDEFYDRVNITKKSLEATAKAHPDTKQKILGVMTDVPSGTKVTRKKA